MSRKIDHQLKVLEVGELIDQGVTFPVRCRLSEEINAIVKYPNNPAGSCALINEWVGNTIAEIDKRNAGLCFFSVLKSNTARVNRRVLSEAKTRETEKLLLFDHLIDNKDRHIGNLLYEVSRDRKVYFIDCSHIMVPSSHQLDDPLDMQWELSNKAILNPYLLENENNNIYNVLCETMGYKEEILFAERDRIRDILTLSRLNDIRETIPVEWVTPFVTRRIQEMFLVLEYRISRIDAIADMIAKERRKGQWRKY